MDYLFRRLALDYLPYEQRAELGIFTADERTAQVAETYDVRPMLRRRRPGGPARPVDASPRRPAVEAQAPETAEGRQSRPSCSN